jgi:hypothetical protein
MAAPASGRRLDATKSHRSVDQPSSWAKPYGFKEVVRGAPGAALLPSPSTSAQQVSELAFGEEADQGEDEQDRGDCECFGLGLHGPFLKHQANPAQGSGSPAIAALLGDQWKYSGIPKLTPTVAPGYLRRLDHAPGATLMSEPEEALECTGKRLPCGTGSAAECQNLFCELVPLLPCDVKAVVGVVDKFDPNGW